jgi:flavin reductase (DIM6/NTAB) family NADH-FMN oxidoreductase RutF
MFYDPRRNDHTCDILDCPRGTAPDRLDLDGEQAAWNPAPYSFFNTVSANPPYVLFSSHPRGTRRSMRRRLRVVVNMATSDLREVMNASSTELAAGSASRSAPASRCARA